jgi:Flp pilus assembly protein TadG
MKASKRTGAATVEFALIAPVLVMLVLGMIETSRFVNANQAVLNASREGARRGTVNGATATDAINVVRECLTSAGFKGSAAIVTVTDAADGTARTVAVTLRYSDFCLMPVSTNNFDAKASTTMRRDTVSQ